MKTFYFGVAWTEYGHAAVEVPEDFTIEEAKAYVLEHWDEIKLPDKHDYIPESDEPDFDYCDFA